jgi:hypothetical protein
MNNVASKIYHYEQPGVVVVATLRPDGWAAVEECGYVPTQVLMDAG